jgi:hypothetical protein
MIHFTVARVSAVCDIQLNLVATHAVMSCTTVQSTQSYSAALPFFYGKLLVIVLLKVGRDPSPPLLASLTEALCRLAPSASAELHVAFPGSTSNLWHEPGYRYRLQDTSIGAVR